MQQLNPSTPEPELLRLAPQGAWTIYEASEIKEALLESIKNTRNAQSSRITRYELDMSQVSEIDSAGVQLLLALMRLVQNQGSSLRLIASSPAVQQVLAFCRLEEALQDG